MKLKRTLRVLISALILVSMVPFSALAAQPQSPVPAAASSARLVEPGSEIEVPADSFGLPISDHEIASLYEKPSVLLQRNDTVSFTVAIPQAGDYTISFEMAATEAFINAPEGQLQVDGAFPLEDA
ncbi:MAG: ABC transporter substrate-binding protein, partial [Anaerolineales bacterium]|nr:ABC transporter substrate-binding protein [Anaerolineales bacterium]